MKAILLVFDEPEYLYITRPLTYKPPGASDEPHDPPAEELIRKRCDCVRNGAMQKTKRLLSHLRGEMKIRKNDIWLLRSSKFRSSEELRRALEIIFKRYRNEDVTLFFAGHGSQSRWFLGRNNGQEKVLYYYELEKILYAFRGRLIVIAECCHALSINQYLYTLTGRYMLLGLSRAQNVGHAFISVLNSACASWKIREFADVRVSEVDEVQDRNTLQVSKMDIVKGNSSVTRIPFYGRCDCGDEVLEVTGFPAGEEPSLRRGSDLDFLFFPRER